MRRRVSFKYWTLAILPVLIALAGCKHTLPDPQLLGCRQDCIGRHPTFLDGVLTVTDDGTVYYTHRDALGTQVIDGECRVIVNQPYGDVWRCRLDGTDQEAVWPGIGGILMSPDGTRALYGGFSPQLIEFTNGSPDSSTIRRLGVSGADFRWRPDGKAIGFRLVAEESGTYVVYPDSSDRVEFITDEILIMDWSPDGRSILGRGWGTFSLGIYNLDDGSVRVLPVDAQSARWSPQGDRIAYAAATSLEPNLRIMYLESESVLNLATFHVYGGLAWTPDGDALIVTRYDRYTRMTSTNGTLWRVNARNGTAVPITDAPCLRWLDP